MADVTFFKCKKCGNLFAVVEAGTCVPQCCGQAMTKLKAGSVEAATEKHIPAVTREGDTIKAQVGEVAHPMLDAHYIGWVALATEDRLDIHHLKPGDAPETTFAAEGVASATVYAYCNLHGLWKAEI